LVSALMITVPAAKTPITFVRVFPRPSAGKLSSRN
jgi:hypothetical protein